MQSLYLKAYKRADMSRPNHISLQINEDSAQNELSDTGPVSWGYRRLGRDPR